MKSLKVFMLAGSLVLFNMNAMSDPLSSTGKASSRSKSTVVEVSAVPSKQQAYQQAMAKLKGLQVSSPLELSNELHLRTFNHQETKSLHLKKGNYITVEERMNENGSIEYVGQVNVVYHYLKQSSKN
ncbi:DUF3316 domain-containing protein [Litoribacillus peritrichatus]|uniref:DUF3316 domain-containing protein n=1 Tax=Litoribacillus peritrichatus TaxID=718191 RepID=A0ABP7MS15_9GAMM